MARLTLLVGALAALLALGLQVRLPVEKHFGYWAVDGRTLGVVALDFPNLDCRVSRIDETSDNVHVHAQCRERFIPLPQTGMAQQYVFYVTLQSSLGSRAVYDGSDTLAQLCEKPAPDCWYSG